MSPKFPYLLLFVCAIRVNGVNLPGDCPNAPSTHHIPIDCSVEEVIRGIPLSTNDESFVFNFKEINSTSASEFAVVFASFEEEVEISLNIYFDTFVPGLQWHSKLQTQNGNESIILKGSAYVQHRKGPEELKCFKRPIETVRIWYDGQFVIIWSCVGISTKQHDEGVIIARTKNNQQNPSDIMKSLQTMARKYLSESIMEKIDWSPTILKRNSKPTYIKTYKCLDRESLSPFIVLLAFLFVFGLLAFAAWNNYYCCKSPIRASNRVVPFVT